MKVIVPYLIFDGDCREAMSFYAEVLGAELDLMDASNMPNCPEDQKNRILHARLASGPVQIMASDNLSGKPNHQGDNVWISVDCSTADEQERLFSRLSGGGSVSMPLQDTFWGAHFGMLTDRFGIHWMFNFDKTPA